MKELALRAVGRASAVLDALRPERETASPLDRTGRVVARAARIPLLADEPDFVYPGFESMAYSFWRAQELSLLRRHGRLAEPAVDFGCGDGSLASVIYDRIAVGVDKDPSALATAAGYGLYGRLVQAEERSVPLPDGFAASAVSNSVLEHTEDAATALAELHRLLAPGGTLVFTVPTAGFRRHLARYFGEALSERINREFYHRHLLEPEEWRARLESAGFTDVRVHGYQPALATFVFMMLRLLGRRALGRWSWVTDAAWRLLGTRLQALARASIAGGVPDPANVLVVARKRA